MLNFIQTKTKMILNTGISLTMPVFYCFRDITISWSKICISYYFTNRSLVLSHRQGVFLRSRVAYESWYKKLRVPGLSDENRMSLRSLVLTY